MSDGTRSTPLLLHWNYHQQPLSESPPATSHRALYHLNQPPPPPPTPTPPPPPPPPLPLLPPALVPPLSPTIAIILSPPSAPPETHTRSLQLYLHSHSNQDTRYSSAFVHSPTHTLVDLFFQLIASAFCTTLVLCSISLSMYPPRSLSFLLSYTSRLRAPAYLALWYILGGFGHYSYCTLYTVRSLVRVFLVLVFGFGFLLWGWMEGGR